MRGYHRFDVEDGLSQPKEKPPPRQKDWKKLAKKCCIALLIVLAVAFVVGTLLPKSSYEHPLTTVSPEGKLKFVAVTHRHGARTGLWKLDFEEEGGLEWDLRLGALTQNGFSEAFGMGQALRATYWKILRQDYAAVSEHVSVFSTYIDRTVDTAHGALLGFFSPDGTQPELHSGDCSCRPNRGDKSDIDCAAQCLGVAVPLGKIPEVQVAEKNLLLQFDECRGWSDQVSEVTNTTTFENKARELFEGQFEAAVNAAGSNDVCIVAESVSDKDTRLSPAQCTPINLKMLERIWNNAQCAKANDQKYVGVENVGKFIDSLTEAVQWYWHQRFQTQAGPLAAGILLNEIVHGMEEHLPKMKSAHSEHRDGMVLYSAHDTTIGALLSVLGIENWNLPYFVSRVVLELRTHDESNLDSFFVRLLYDDQALEIPGCSKPCMWEDFARLMAPRQRDQASCDAL